MEIFIFVKKDMECYLGTYEAKSTPWQIKETPMQILVMSY